MPEMPLMTVVYISAKQVRKENGGRGKWREREENGDEENGGRGKWRENGK
jgi:hypothetical protein